MRKHAPGYLLDLISMDADKFKELSRQMVRFGDMCSLKSRVKVTQESRDIPMITMEELSTLLSQGYFVMKPCGNKIQQDYDNELEYVLKDKSIGIHFRINTPLPFNVTDEQIRHSSPTLLNIESNMLDIKLLDIIIDLSSIFFFT